ncbi:hypothetical protein XELAEV_18028285mg, partial [Xenopus laevis]
NETGILLLVMCLVAKHLLYPEIRRPASALVFSFMTRLNKLHSNLFLRKVTNKNNFAHGNGKPKKQVIFEEC